jgi:hypothetical protein
MEGSSTVKCCSATAALHAATLFCLAVSAAAASEIILPSTVLNRDATVTATYHMPRATTGAGTLSIHWTDSLGRVVEDSTIPVTLTDESDIHFPLDMRRAVAMKNELSAHLKLDGKDRKDRPDPHDETATIRFVARPPERDWKDYAIIMWQQYPGKLIPALQQLGINGGQYVGRNTTLPDFFIDNNMRWYSENIGTDYYSEYHRFRPDRIQHWSFLQAKDLYAKDPSSKEAFKRHPSFWDPEWRAKIHDRLVEAAKRFSPYRPFFYSLADESGIADLAAFWDFDFSDQSLVPMRRWLQERYGTLDALNRQWDSNFTTWDLVTPPTTHEAMQRPGDNFSAWADFKEWMDISYAEALRMGADAIHEVDKDAFVNIGGGQRPGWGGYDYARISQVLNAIEPYDIGNNVEIIRSLNPEMVMLSTGFAKGPWEQQRVWRELFHGQRGLIIWDEKREYAGEDGKPGARGLEAAKYYNEIRDGAGALIINSQPVTDPIAIHYSQASMRTEWMLARRPEGDAWIKRNARVERTDDDFLRLRESWCELIEDQGMQYKFVSYGQLEHGELLRSGYRVFILPRSSSLSPGEVQAIRDFVAQGGVVIADGEPGVFDEHSRRLPSPALADLFGPAAEGKTTERQFGKGKAILLHTGTLDYLQNRLMGKEEPVHKEVGDLLRASGIRPEFAITDASGQAPVGIEQHVFRNGGVYLLTLLSNPLLRVDELGPPDFKSNRRFEKPVTVTVTLPQSMYVYDTRARAALGQKQKLSVTVQPYEPVILAVSPMPLPALHLFAPDEAARGSVVHIGLQCPRTPASVQVLHVEVATPDGKRALQYTGNVLARDGRAVKSFPLAVNDPSGEWTIRVHDLMSGQTVTQLLKVK